MGDKFENIQSSAVAARGGIATRGDHTTVVNRSHLSNLENIYGSDVQRALEAIAEHLQKYHASQAEELFASFNEEIAKPHAKKSVLKALWTEFKGVLPHASEIASALKVMAKIFL